MIDSSVRNFRFFPENRSRGFEMPDSMPRNGSARVSLRAATLPILFTAACLAAAVALGGASGDSESAGDGLGLRLFKAFCTKCHTPEHASARAKKIERRADLLKAVEGMLKKGGLGEPSGEEIDAVASWLLHDGEAQRSMPGALAKGKALCESKCAYCHGLDYVDKAAKNVKTASGWADLVAKERARDESAFSAEEAAEIAKYLEWLHPPPSKEGENAILAKQIQSKCSLCHEFSLGDLEDRLPADWELTVELMRRLNPFNIGVAEARRIAAFLGERYALKPASAEEQAAAMTVLLFRRKCSLCHSLSLSKTPGEYFEDWDVEVDRMRAKSPSFISGSESSEIAGFLSGKK